jgi:hypothetical protein
MKNKSNNKLPIEVWCVLAAVFVAAWLVVGIGIADKVTNTQINGSSLTLIVQSPRNGITRASFPVACACPGWPWNNPLVISAISGMEASVAPFFKNIPEQMVQSGYVMEYIHAGVLPRTNLEFRVVQLFRNAAKERGVLLPTPFAICGCNDIGVWNTGKLSVGAEHGWGAGDEDWRREFYAFFGAFEVRPDLSTNSCVMYATVFANELPVSFVVRWNEVFLNGDPNLCATFEVEFFAGREDVVYRYFAGCGNEAVQTNCVIGVMMSGAGWTTTGVGAGREMRLRRLRSLEEEKAARIPELKITQFEAWYYRIKLNKSYAIPPGLLLYFGLCPHHIENAMAVLPPDVADFINNYPLTLADLLMKHVLNPFEWTPDTAILSTVDPESNPGHSLLTPGNGKVPIYITQTAPLEEDTLALLLVNNMRLLLSATSTPTRTIYITP